MRHKTETGRRSGAASARSRDAHAQAFASPYALPTPSAHLNRGRRLGHGRAQERAAAARRGRVPANGGRLPDAPCRAARRRRACREAAHRAWRAALPLQHQGVLHTQRHSERSSLSATFLEGAKAADSSTIATKGFFCVPGGVWGETGPAPQELTKENVLTDELAVSARARESQLWAREANGGRTFCQSFALSHSSALGAQKHRTQPINTRASDTNRFR